jgi:hypothetical protein
VPIRRLSSQAYQEQNKSISDTLTRGDLTRVDMLRIAAVRLRTNPPLTHLDPVAKLHLALLAFGLAGAIVSTELGEHRLLSRNMDTSMN